MQIEGSTLQVGKVYKCGDTFVLIEYKSQTLSKWRQYDYIGIECSGSGKCSLYSRVGRYHKTGHWSQDNNPALRYVLEELPKRETIQVGDSKFYLDEFEAATKSLKRVEE